MQQQPATQPQVRIIRPFDDIVVYLDEVQGARVEVKAWACLDAGWLEQVACSPNTREHESLVVIKAKASHVHAALLLAGFVPGAPGRWMYENETLSAVPPRGEKLDVLVRYLRTDEQVVEEPVRNWIRDIGGPNATLQAFPPEPWVFGGSSFAPNPNWMEPEGGEHYVADITGSIIGIVTFGDEVVGFSRVFADQADIQPPEWEVNTEAVPEIGTEVTIVLKKWKGK